MAVKQRLQNPVVGDTVKLSLLTYNQNGYADVNRITKVEIYYLDPNEKTEENPDGRQLYATITDIDQDDVGQYSVSIDLIDTSYKIGNYRDVWSISFEEAETELGRVATVENNFTIYPDLWYVSPNKLIHDFSFQFQPNRIVQGSKKYLVVQVTPNVPNGSDLERYYMNIATTSPIKIFISLNCGDCVPDEEDLRLIVDEEDVESRQQNLGYYLLDTTDYDRGIYDVWFKMEHGECIFVSEKSQLQIS